MPEQVSVIGYAEIMPDTVGGLDGAAGPVEQRQPLAPAAKRKGR
ncbi:hypothetical protein [Sodalis-like endosymbiont of Proechinophthirus fluctus]|nr:hypothetical protein [Sodalis-like endosymbiont of Proechinophthirus fluctus]